MEKPRNEPNPERPGKELISEEAVRIWAQQRRSKLADEIAEALISGLRAGVEKQQKENPPDAEWEKGYMEIVNKWKAGQENRLNKPGRKPPTP